MIDLLKLSVYYKTRFLFGLGRVGSNLNYIVSLEVFSKYVTYWNSKFWGIFQKSIEPKPGFNRIDDINSKGVNDKGTL